MVIICFFNDLWGPTQRSRSDSQMVGNVCVEPSPSYQFHFDKLCFIGKIGWTETDIGGKFFYLLKKRPINYGICFNSVQIDDAMLFIWVRCVKLLFEYVLVFLPFTVLHGFQTRFIFCECIQDNMGSLIFFFFNTFLTENFNY